MIPTQIYRTCLITSLLYGMYISFWFISLTSLIYHHVMITALEKSLMLSHLFLIHRYHLTRFSILGKYNILS